LIVATFTALYDASVLYPAPLRDLLMHLAATELFRARWSEAIHNEWMGSLLRDRQDITREQLERTRDLMNATVLDCLVVGFEDLIPVLTLPDADDRHVLAAAIRARADVIVTTNLRDFPPDVLARYGVEAQHPDEFVHYLIDLSPGPVCRAVKAHRASLKNPPKSVGEYLDTLSRQSLPETVSALREFTELI